MVAGSIPVETIRPRRWQQQPGDRLILVPDASEWVRRIDEFERTLGEAQAEFIYNLPAFATPLYERHPEGPAGIPLEVAWHPVFWLPTKLAAPLPDESDGEWGYRVCRAFIEHGVYVAEDGTWVDVLAWLGMSLDHPADRARVQTWLAGNPDPLLDGLDWDTLNGLYPDTPETDHVAAQDAVMDYDEYEEAQWVLTTHSIVEMITSELEDIDEQAAAEKAPEVFDKVAPLVISTLAEAPEAIDGYGPIWDSIEPISAALREPGADTVELLGDLTSQVVALHDTYLSSLTRVLADEDAEHARSESGTALETIPDGP